jgi:hypothetical protein
MGEKKAPPFARRGSEEGTIWYYEELAKTFKEVLPGQLADELGEIVEVLKASKN